MMEIIFAVLLFCAGFVAGMTATVQSRMMRPPPDPGPIPDYPYPPEQQRESP